MSSPQVTELRLAATKEEALQAILAELPKLAIVRDEEDGVGKYAGVRTVAILGTDRDRLLLFDDAFANIKSRLDADRIEGQVEVSLQQVPQGTVARIKEQPVAPRGAAGLVMDFVQNGITVAAVYAGYHWIKSIPIDYAMLAGVGAGGGAVWTALAVTLGKRGGKGKKEDEGLASLVRRGLRPLQAEDEDEDESES
ncbi:MAG: hypothetical protein H6712_11480 [Myxococcales bacterium]|nr:hypothetical protein [Myxococcales bacterium]MCB9714474.1 hypothetical protein [Myxococcales bacterium]